MSRGALIVIIAGIIVAAIAVGILHLQQATSRKVFLKTKTQRREENLL